MSLDILLAEDEPTLLAILGDSLEDAGHRVTRVEDGSRAARLLSRGGFDLLVSDIRLPHRDGYELARLAFASQMDVILMTAHGDVGRAVEMMRLGAHDYLTKPFHEDQLVAAVDEVQVKRTSQDEEDAGPVAESTEMREVLRLARRVAPSTVSVLLQGETGSGKDVVARFIHSQSLRADAPFLVANCAAISSELIESELFGHERGAFTGAKDSRKGWIRAAEGGTLFLDEIGELPASAQSRLLRALENREVVPVGSDRAIPVDIRVVAATNRDLREDVAKGKFREDLLYRLNAFELTIPPLRARPLDLPPLTRIFIQRIARRLPGAPTGITDEALAVLAGYHWPGNIRELRNCLEHACVLAVGAQIHPEHLPARIRGQGDFDDSGLDLRAAVGRVEAEQIRRALAVTEGRRGRAADLLGISRKHLWELMKRYEIE